MKIREFKWLLENEHIFSYEDSIYEELFERFHFIEKHQPDLDFSINDIEQAICGISILKQIEESVNNQNSR